MSLLSHIESILFVASKPLSCKAIAKAIGKNESEVRDAIESLALKYNREDSGIRIIQNGDEAVMGTNPANATAVDQFIRDEASGELTRAQLETLTVIAYRGPLTRPEIEQIRGVNCAVILRNLLVRGLVAETDDAATLSPSYSVSFETLRHLGIRSTEELPEYEELLAHEHVEQILTNDENN